jgi:hypothetical protein
MGPPSRSGPIFCLWAANPHGRPGRMGGRGFSPSSDFRVRRGVQESPVQKRLSSAQRTETMIEAQQSQIERVRRDRSQKTRIDIQPRPPTAAVKIDPWRKPRMLESNRAPKTRLAGGMGQLPPRQRHEARLKALRTRRRSARSFPGRGVRGRPSRSRFPAPTRPSSLAAVAPPPYSR